MNGIETLTMGDRGRVVIPANTRQRYSLNSGSTLVLIETSNGLVLLTRDQLKSRVRADYKAYEGNLIDELLQERRIIAAQEDAG